MQYFSQSHKSEIFLFALDYLIFEEPHVFLSFQYLHEVGFRGLGDNAEPEILILTQGIQICRWALLSGIHPL